MERDLALVALANACGHRALAERAKDLGAAELLTKVLKANMHPLSGVRKNVVSASLTRLERHDFSGGDVEEGDGGGEEGGGGGGRGLDDSLRFYRFKWDAHRFIAVWGDESSAQACNNASIRLLLVFGWVFVVCFLHGALR